MSKILNLVCVWIIKCERHLAANKIKNMPPFGRIIDFLNTVTKCKLLRSRDVLSRQILLKVLTIMLKCCLKSQKEYSQKSPKTLFWKCWDYVGRYSSWVLAFAVFATLRRFLKLGISKLIVLYPHFDTKVEPLNSDQTARHFPRKRHEIGKRFTVSFSIWYCHCAQADTSHGC